MSTRSRALAREFADSQKPHFTERGMQVFEVILPSFSGSTDRTDDRVRWVRASSRERVIQKYPKAQVSLLPADVQPHDESIDEVLR